MRSSMHQAPMLAFQLLPGRYRALGVALLLTIALLALTWMPTLDAQATVRSHLAGAVESRQPPVAVALQPTPLTYFACCNSARCSSGSP